MNGRSTRRSGRISRWLYDYRWSLIGLLAATTFGLGAVGFWIHLGAAGEPRTITQVMYLSLQLFVLDSGGVAPPTPLALDVARFLAPVVAFSAAIGALGAFFQEQFQMMRVRRSAGHVVVCGAGWRGSFIARRFQDAGWRVVVIEHDEDAPGLAACRAVGIPVINGDATDLANLTRARTAAARYLISVCGGDEDTLQVAVAARGLEPRERELRPHLLLHMSDRRLAALAQTAGGDGADATRVASFNVYERGARAWVQEHPPFSRGGAAPPADPHLLIVGFGQMGRYVAAEAIRTWLATRSTDRRLRLTVIDREAERKARDLELDYPALGRFATLRALSMDVEDPEFREGAFLAEDGQGPITAVYVCMKDTTLSLTAALHVQERIGEPAVPIVIRTQEEAGLSRVLRWSQGVADFENLRAFPVLERACAPEVLLGTTALDVLAQEAHDSYNRFVGARHAAEGNPSVTGWDELPEHLRESNRRQVMHIGAKLAAIGCAVSPASGPPVADEAARAIGCRVIPAGAAAEHELTSDEVERLARMEHDRWVAERLFDGWTYAPGPKDIARKTTPDLAPWEELSEEVRDLDRNVARAIPSILARVGLRVVSDPSGRGGSAAC